jgi:hypothetical protein
MAKAKYSIQDIAGKQNLQYHSIHQTESEQETGIPVSGHNEEEDQAGQDAGKNNQMPGFFRT